MTGVCFTGHRAVPYDERARLTEALDRTLAELYARGYTDYFAGGAVGFDMLAAEAVLRLRETYPVRLHLVLPCRDQTKKWDTESVVRYKAILGACDSIDYVSDFYHPRVMLERNERLLSAADVCVAYCTREVGGSAYTVRRARALKKEVIFL